MRLDFILTSKSIPIQNCLQDSQIQLLFFTGTEYTYDLPLGATQLATSKNFENQAFQVGSGVGIQFHLEVSSAMVNHWIGNTEQKLKRIQNINPNQICNEIESKISIVNSNMERFYKNFKKVFNL